MLHSGMAKPPVTVEDGKIVLNVGKEFEVDAQGTLHLTLASPKLLLRDAGLGIDLPSLKKELAADRVVEITDETGGTAATDNVLSSVASFADVDDALATIAAKINEILASEVKAGQRNKG